ncbi:hypothetical protein RHECNPAF_850066 [Rhizobium etli CNPAF512]|nr:hypothetical protein RHECNPAF_850066 [Rhizobium etli CNPAF512]
MVQTYRPADVAVKTEPLQVMSAPFVGSHLGRIK